MASEIETLEEKKHEDAAMEVEEKDNEETKQEDEGSDVEEKDEGEESKGGSKRRRQNSGKKEPVTPVDRPTRERKTVERYTESMQRLITPKPFSIEKGSGTQLKDIPNVAYKLSKRKADDTLQSLHTVLFSKRAKMNTVKKNIGQFSGFVWADDELEKQRLKVKEKLDKFTKEKLFEFCDILNLQILKSSLKKEEVSLKLLEFLQSPHATTEVLLAEKEQKAKNKKAKARKSRTPSTKKSGEKRKRTPKAKEEKNLEEDEGSESEDESKEEDDEKNTPSKPESDEEMVKSDEEGGDEEDENNPGSDNEKEKSEDEGGDDEEEDKSESDEDKDKSEKQEKSSSKKIVKKDSKAVKKDDVESPAKSNKKSKKAATPASSAKSKASSTKKGKEEKGSKKVEAKSSAKKDSAKDQGKGKANKKAKAEPTNEEMHAVVVSILKEVDFNTATLSDIIKQLGTHFGQDLLHRKAEVKAIITDVINNMSGDEDEEEEKEAGSGSDEDGDGDNSDS